MKKAFKILIALLLMSVVLNVWLATREVTEGTTVERDTMWRDSMIYLPQPAETVNTGRVVYIKIPMPNGDTQGTVPLCHDSTQQGLSPSVTNGSDSISVPIPIVQKRYDDSLYTAWVSGYEPALDSIRLHLPEVQTVITRTVVKPSPLITFGIQTGAGWGFINHRPDLYIGIGGQINLWRK